MRTAIAICLLAASAHAAPIRHKIASIDTDVPDRALWIYNYPIEPFTELAFLESKIDATIDHQTGAVEIHRWDVFGPNGIVYSVPPHSAQLKRNPGDEYYRGQYFSGETALGRLNFWPVGSPNNALDRGGGSLLVFLPKVRPTTSEALLPAFPNLKPWSMSDIVIQTPEPGSAALALLSVLGLAARRGQQLPVSCLD